MGKPRMHIAMPRSNGGKPRHNGPYIVISNPIITIYGQVSTGVNRPILSEIVPSEERASVFGFLVAIGDE